MSEWWTYRLSDFLMFSPRTYWRLVESTNRELWPAHVALLAVGAASVLLAWRGKAPRAVLIAVAAAWLVPAWGFLWPRYAQINWGASYLAAAFVVQAAALVAAAALHPRNAAHRHARVGLAIALAGLAYPLVPFLAGRPFAQAEVFGLMPDPTALVTLGVLLALPLAHGLRAALLVIPVLALASGAATHWAMAG